MTATNLPLSGARLWDSLMEMARIGATPKGGCNRQTLTDLDSEGRHLLRQVKTRGAEGVIFAAASFCDPALLERPMLLEILGKHKIPYTAFKFAENTGQMAPIREQTGTFADSIKLWSAA